MEIRAEKAAMEEHVLQVCDVSHYDFTIRPYTYKKHTASDFHRKPKVNKKIKAKRMKKCYKGGRR